MFKYKERPPEIPLKFNKPFCNQQTIPSRKVSPLVKNTVALNLRVLVVAGISLFTTRLVLAKLGAEDFGIFAVIAGFTGMLAFVNAALATGTQRHVAFSLGAGNLCDARKWFSIGLFFHLAFAVILLLIAETLGLAIFERFLIIPPGKQYAAFWLYQASVLSTVFTVVIVPFQALFNAYEEMHVVAILSVIQNILLLLLALLLYVLPWDPLMLYGVGFCAVTVFMTILNWAVARARFEICKLDTAALRDRMAMKELAVYSGWNLFGAGAGVARVQGITILLNFFFGPVANAAFFVANQIASQIAFLSQSLLRAINPQIVKSEGASNRVRMVRLTNLSSKYSLFLLSLIAVPLILETEFILSLWLQEVPQSAILFTKLILVAALVDQLTVGVMTAVQAMGKVSLYQAVVGSTLILNLAIGYALFTFGMPAYSILVASIFVYLVAGMLRLGFMKRLSGMKLRVWFFDVLGRTIAWMAMPVLVASFFLLAIPPGLMRLLVVTGAYFVIAGLGFYFWGIGGEERRQLQDQGRAIWEKLNSSLRVRS